MLQFFHTKLSTFLIISLYIFHLVIQKAQNYHGLIILMETWLHEKVNLENVKEPF
jgi:hypothetical protein